MSPTIFVVDGGFGFFKYLYNNQKGKIRSCYKKIGDKWIIGEKALLETSSGYIRTVNELIELHPIFVKHCQEKANAYDAEILVTGLPLGAYEEKAEELQKKLSNLGFKKILVFPQGLGGIKHFLSKQKLKKGNILGVDIGFNTVITTLYNIEEKETLLGKTYYKKGVNDLVVSFLFPRVKKFIGDKTLTPQELNYLIEHKKLQMGFEIIDVSYEVNESIKEYTEDLLNFIVNDIESEFGIITFEHLIFFGGGANWLKNKLTSQKVNITILEEPEYANAYGFEIKAKEILEAESKTKNKTT